MFRRIQAAVVATVAFSLVGCAGVTQQSYNAASAPPLKKVLIVTQAQPPKISVGIGGSIGLMFGGIGAGMAAANANSQGQTLDQLITGEGLNYHQRLQEKIVASLAAAGIQAEVAPAARERFNSFVTDYQPLAAKHKADAILDLVVLEASYGGTHPLLDPKPRPILKVRTRLVDAAKFNQLYGEAISFGYSNPFESAKELKAPEKYYFSGMQALGEDKKRAAEGLGVAADEVARYVVSQFAPAGRS